MSVSDPIADMLTKVRNASRAGNASVVLNDSNVSVEIIKILKAEGYIHNFRKLSSDDSSGKKFIQVSLKYSENKEPAIKEIKRVSKPGCRVYAGYRFIPKVKSGLGTVIVSTSFGIMNDRRAFQQKVGGEILCSVW